MINEELPKALLKASVEEGGLERKPIQWHLLRLWLLPNRTLTELAEDIGRPLETISGVAHANPDRCTPNVLIDIIRRVSTDKEHYPYTPTLWQVELFAFNRKRKNPEKDRETVLRAIQPLIDDGTLVDRKGYRVLQDVLYAIESFHDVFKGSICDNVYEEAEESARKLDKLFTMLEAYIRLVYEEAMSE